MRNKRFGWVPTLTSAVGFLLGAIFMGIQINRACDTSAQRALWVGAFLLIPFVLGFLGLQLGLLLDGAYKVQRPKGWFLAFLLACVLLFGIGFGGQHLFMYSKPEVVVTSTEVDMVLALDASGSMKTNDYEQPRNEAASQFIDSLSDDTRLQVISFADIVLDSTNLVSMNASNKASHKNMIASINSIGGTDFNEPMELAKDTLDDKARSGAKKVVILLTDGEGYLNANVISDYKGSDILFFPVRIWSDASLTRYSRPLVDLAKSTGGFDTLLIPRADGTVDTSAMLRAFQKVFQSTTSTKTVESEGTIIFTEEETTVFQRVIRVVVLFLCSVLVSYGYFGRFRVGSAIAAGVMGVGSAILVTILDGVGFVACVPVFLILFGTAFVFYDLEEGAQIDV